MSTKAAALYQFFSGFGLPAYTATSVPSEAKFPYLTYEPIMGGFGEEQPLYASLWYREEGETKPNAKAEEISKAIGLGGRIIACDGGAMWIRRGEPWSQSMGDDTDDMVKRRLLSLTIEFFTQD